MHYACDSRKRSIGGRNMRYKKKKTLEWHEPVDIAWGFNPALYLFGFVMSVIIATHVLS